MARYDPLDAGFLCDRAIILGTQIKETPL